MGPKVRLVGPDDVVEELKEYGKAYFEGMEG